MLTRSEFSKLKEKDQKDSYDLDLKTYTTWQDGWTKLKLAGQNAKMENDLQQALRGTGVPTCTGRTHLDHHIL